MKQKQKNIPNNKILSKKINTNKSRVTQHKNRAISSENRSNKRNKSKQKIKIEEEKNFKENQESIKRYRTNINYSMNLVNEKKKNSLNRLIDTSMNLLEQQNDILKQANSLMQNIEINNHEISKIKKKEEKQNFCKNIGKYNENLEDILSKLKLNTREVDYSKRMKEENNNLKYQMQMLSIDKSDDFRNIEAELNSLKNLYTNEMNSMLRYLYELGIDNVSLSSGNIKPENLNAEIIANFFNLMKNTIKQLKLNNEEKEGQIELLKKIKNVENDHHKSFDKDNNTNNNILNLNLNYSSTDNYKNNINNNRIKKIEELCLKHTYDIDNIKENNNIISQSYMDNFKRSKNTLNNELNYNSDLGIQLEHNYTDSYFYPNVKESLSKNKKNDEINNNENNNDDNNIKEYISRINESQPMNKFI
jgi:hypothetical protein